MALTQQQKEIVDFLESLVGQRFNMETLSKVMAMFPKI